MSEIVSDVELRHLFDDHVGAVIAGDLPAIVAGYAADAVLMHAGGVEVGRAAIEAFYAGRPRLPRPELRVRAAGDALFVIWTLEGDDGQTRTGTETLVVRDGLIVLHTGFSPQR